MIPKVDPKKRFWVVRADGGHYFSFFLDRSIVGISHADELSITENHLSNKTLEALAENLPATGLSSSRQKQAFRFINQIQKNDWIITIGKDDVAFGIVTSDAYLDGAGIPNKNYFLGLRRNIKWGTILKRNKLPYEIQIALKCNQTLFNIDSCREAIYHSLFPFFLYNKNLHITIQITTQKNIKTKDIISLFELIDDIDEVSKFPINDDPHRRIETQESIVKAQFKSPGDVWAIYNDIKEITPSWILWTVGVYAGIFGNKLIGFDGLIDSVTKQKFVDLLIEKIKSKRTKSAIDELKIDFPSDDFSKILPDKEKIDPKFDITPPETQKKEDPSRN